jgi:hypothetical protein
LLRRGVDVSTGNVSGLAWSSGGAVSEGQQGRPTYMVRPYSPDRPAAPGERVVFVYDPYTAEEWTRIAELERLCGTGRTTQEPCSSEFLDAYPGFPRERVAVEVVTTE